MKLEKIPKNNEHPYFLSLREKKHYWWPTWTGVMGGKIEVSEDGNFKEVLANGERFSFHPFSQKATEMEILAAKMQTAMGG